MYIFSHDFETNVYCSKQWGNFKISYFFGLSITYEDNLLDYYNSWEYFIVQQCLHFQINRNDLYNYQVKRIILKKSLLLK